MDRAPRLLGVGLWGQDRVAQLAFIAALWLGADTGRALERARGARGRGRTVAPAWRWRFPFWRTERQREERWEVLHSK